jgi:PAS domain S-box-containing protein
MVDSVPGMIVTANAKGEHEYASKSALDYTGTTVEQMSGFGFIHAIHPEEQELVKNEWLRCNKVGQPLETDHRWRRFDGLYRWFRVRVHPRLDEKGEIVRWYGLLTDIEDQRQAEEALRKSEQHLRLLVETLPAVVWRATAEGAIDYANQRLGEYLGKPRRYVTGDEWIGELHPEDVDVTVEKWRHSCRAGSSYDTTFRLRRANGEYRWVQMIGEPLRDTGGQILNWYGLMLDIDDPRRAEQALQEREAHLRGVLETVPALVTRSTPEGRLEYVNQRVVDYLGANVEQIGFEAVHPDDRDVHLKKWLSCLDTGEPCEETYRLRRVDGEYRWFFVRIEALRDSEGRVASWYAVHIDVDDSRKIAEELRHTQARLSRASRVATVAELSASIAHEINQPLAAVVANGHACHAWLSNDPPNLTRARLTAERIITNGNSAAEVVRRIRALFKQAPPAMALAAINEIAVEVLTLVADETRDHGVVVATDLAAGMPMILIDRIQIQQVLVNLVHNAIEAMEGLTDRPKELVVVSRREAGEIRVEVRDRGRGLANPTSVFDPFFTTKENGMGMGLAICRSIIETHGGHLWATPNKGDGTTFSFTVPLHSETQA